MSDGYRYVVFAPCKQPTVEEMDQLKQWASVTKQRYAVGINSNDGGLAMAFEARAFDSSCSTDGDLAVLVRHWRVRGCEIRERLLFIKNPTALQPIPGSKLHESVELRIEPLLKRKQQAASEALGRAGLKFQQTLQHHAWLARVASVVPYALMGLGGFLTIIAGIYFGQRLLDSPAERRQQTIKRVAGDAMGESLMVRGKPTEAAVESNESAE